MNIQINNSSLKQARKNVGISLSTMADILLMDVSNLSKYERGIKKPTSHIILGYHLLTNVSIQILWRDKISIIIKFLIDELTEKLTKLEREVQTPKIKSLISTLSKPFNNLSCLQDMSEDEEKKYGTTK